MRLFVAVPMTPFSHVPTWRPEISLFLSLSTSRDSFSLYQVVNWHQTIVCKAAFALLLIFSDSRHAAIPKWS
jgi:hypothetical protein